MDSDEDDLMEDEDGSSGGRPQQQVRRPCGESSEILLRLGGALARAALQDDDVIHHLPPGFFDGVNVGPLLDEDTRNVGSHGMAGQEEVQGLLGQHALAAVTALAEKKRAEDAVVNLASSTHRILSDLAKNVTDAAYDITVLQTRTDAELQECRTREATARSHLEKAVDTFEEERATSLRLNETSAQTMITLCVGGSPFTTSLSTLQKEPDSMLGAMFSGRHAIHKQADGSVFIDRDPTHFRYILNFLRDGAAALPPPAPLGNTTTHRNTVVREELLREAQFFQISAMIEELEDASVRRNAICAAAGGTIKEGEDDIRARLLSSDEAVSTQALVDAKNICIDVFATPSTSWANDSKAPPPENCTLFFGDDYLRGWRFEQARKESTTLAPTCTDPVICSEHCFMENWRVMTLGSLSQLDWTGVIVAGGSILGCLLQLPEWAQVNDQNRMYYHNKAVTENDDFEFDLGIQGRDPISAYHTTNGYHFPCADYGDCDFLKDTSGWEASDIDLFLVGLTRDQALDKIRHVHQALEAAWGATPENKNLTVVRTDFAITFVGGWPRRHIQIILRLYRSPAEVLLGFDIDACCVAFDGTRVLALPRAQRALTKCYNIVDPTRRSTTYEARLFKYALRGFAVAVPSFDEHKLRGKTAITETHGLARLLVYELHQRACKTKRPNWYAKPLTLLDVAEGSMIDSQRREALNRVCGIVASDYCSTTCKMDFLEFYPTVDGFTCRNRIAKQIMTMTRQLQADSLPFLYADNIEKVLHWPSSELVEGKQYGQTYSHHTSVSSEVEFVAIDPGRQYITGSFHPDDRDWYSQAYGEEEVVES